MFRIGEKVVVINGELKKPDGSGVAKDMKGMTGTVLNYTDLGGENLHQVGFDAPLDPITKQPIHDPHTGPHQFFKPEQLKKLS